MSIYVNNQYRIRVNLEQQELMRRMTQAHLFEGYKDILMISAIIGYNFGKYEPITKYGEPILMSFFGQRDYDVIDLIAFSREKKQTILNSDDKYEIFENYANGGFPILIKKLGINVEDNIDTDYAKKAMCKFYSQLLSNDYSRTDLLEDKDLFVV